MTLTNRVTSRYPKEAGTYLQSFALSILMRSTTATRDMDEAGHRPPLPTLGLRIVQSQNVKPGVCKATVWVGQTCGSS
jgi:hypothetical protein